MAQFPHIYVTGLEAGALDTGGTATDTESKITYPHYTALIGKHGFAPWRGAHCMLIDQSGGSTTEAIVTVAGCDIAAAGYWSVAFALYAKGTVMANGDRTTLAALRASATDEATLQLYYTTTGGLQLLLTEAYDTAVGSNPVAALSENEWHWIELYGVNDPGANDGTTYLVLDGRAAGNIGSLNQGAFTDLVIGLTAIDAGHNGGYYAIDDVTISGTDTDAVRVGYRSRYPMTPHVSAIANTTYGEHLFLGPGTVREISLLTDNAGDVIRLYDTDRGYTTGEYGMIPECVDSSYPIAGPFEFSRGCYCEITAASINGARGLVAIDPAPPTGYAKALYYGNEANLRRYAIESRKELTGSR